MLNPFLVLGFSGLLAACGGDDTGKDETDSEAEDSCWFDGGICFDYDGDTQAWCDGMAEQYTSLGIAYSANPCSGDEVGSCSIPSGAGDFVDAGAVASYYSPAYDTPSAEIACSASGGSFSEIEN